MEQAPELTRVRINCMRRKPRRVVTLLTALRTDTTHDLSQKRPERILIGVGRLVTRHRDREEAVKKGGVLNVSVRVGYDTYTLYSLSLWHLQDLSSILALALTSSLLEAGLTSERQSTPLNYSLHNSTCRLTLVHVHAHRLAPCDFISAHL
jgi:hypothetical protein